MLIHSDDMGPSPGAEQTESEAALADFVRAERVRFVFIQSALPMFFSPIGGAILSLALWNCVARNRLVFWTAGLVVIALVRLTLVRAYPSVTPGARQVRQWERTFVLSIVVVDLWWGVGALLLLPATPAESALVFAFVMLMAGGHSASYAAHPATVTLGILALTLPITTHFALQLDLFHGAMAIVAAMYLAATFRSIRTLSYFFGRTHRLAHEVQRERDRAEQMARTDFLTQLNNRRAFYELADAALRHARRYERPIALLMLDIDHFKTINDKFGHAAGDAAICAVAQLIREQYRATDIAGRLGGEEFALLLPEIELFEALAVAERLRLSVGAYGLEHEGHVIRFTTSIGVAALQADETIDLLMARADAALYRAKHAGRNSVAPAEA